MLSEGCCTRSIPIVDGRSGTEEISFLVESELVKSDYLDSGELVTEALICPGGCLAPQPGIEWSWPRTAQGVPVFAPDQPMSHR